MTDARDAKGTGTADTTFCYVVLAHDPRGVAALVRRIRELSVGAAVLVRAQPGQGFDPVEVTDAGGELFLSPVRARWGAWSLVEAELEALDRARRGFGRDYTVLVSGQDYPIRNLSAWEREVAASRVDALIRPSHPRSDDVRSRWRVLESSRPVPDLAHRVGNRLGSRARSVSGGRVTLYSRHAAGDPRWWLGVGTRRAIPEGIRPTKGSQWLTLSARALEAVLDRHERDARVRSWFSGVRVPDEWYVPTLIASHPGLRVDHRPTTAFRFDPHSESPQILDQDLLLTLAASGAAFARKMPFEEGAATALRRVADSLTNQNA